VSKRELWRVKRAGKFIGSWHFTAPGGARINTHTLDASAALKFRREWLRSHPAKSGSEGAAEVVAALAGDDGASRVAPATAEAPPAADPPPAAPLPFSPPALPPISPDGYRPVDGDWTAGVNAAAAGAAGEAPGEQAPPLDPAFLEGIVVQAATLAIEAQIIAQEFVLRRWGKIKPGEVAPDSVAREPGRKLWEAQIRAWIPTDWDLPPWLMAIALTAMATVPVQIGGATPLPKTETEKAPDAPPA
jgi:hypothetical protein